MDTCQEPLAPSLRPEQDKLQVPVPGPNGMESEPQGVFRGDQLCVAGGQLDGQPASVHLQGCRGRCGGGSCAVWRPDGPALDLRPRTIQVPSSDGRGQAGCLLAGASGRRYRKPHSCLDRTAAPRSLQGPKCPHLSLPLCALPAALEHSLRATLVPVSSSQGRVWVPSRAVTLWASKPGCTGTASRVLWALARPRLRVSSRRGPRSRAMTSGAQGRKGQAAHAPPAHAPSGGHCPGHPADPSRRPENPRIVPTGMTPAA